MSTGSRVSLCVSPGLIVVALSAVVLTGCQWQTEEANRQGISAMERGDFAKAVEEFTVVVEAQPKLSGGYRNRGDAYLAMANKDPVILAKAVADYTAAVELRPSEPELAVLYRRRGSAFVDLGRPQEAAADLDEAIKIISTDPQSYLLRADCRLKLRDIDGAAADLRQVATLAPPNPRLLGKLADAFLQIGQFDDALNAANKYLEVADPQSKHLGHLVRAKVFFQKRRFEDTIAECTSAIEFHPEDGRAYYDRGFARLQIGEHDAAITDFSKVIEKEPGHLLAHLQRAVAREQVDDWLNAISDLDMVIEKAPKLAAAYLQRGRLRAKLGEHPAAVEDLTRAIERQPSADAYRLRAASHEALGDDKWAKQDEAEAERLGKK